MNVAGPAKTKKPLPRSNHGAEERRKSGCSQYQSTGLLAVSINNEAPPLLAVLFNRATVTHRTEER